MNIKKYLSFPKIIFPAKLCERGMMLKEVTFAISDDLHRYLSFLEKSRFVKNREDTLNTALEFYRMLAMHDWLPFAYRMGGGRIMLMDTTTILDFLHLLTNEEILNAARTSALKRKVTNPFFKDIDFSRPDNWSLVLREMEIMGWGKFSRSRNEIQVEACILPAFYLKGYFEGMFGYQFSYQVFPAQNTMIFVGMKEKKE
ncbi:MAG: hypothetical protein JSV05_09335 [Candidatus Bathyarchaeota archaeon]|nr:MAG: hypothetical protein JSV05_09335 [Candidatus Bathyarchaeota archaeon]